MSIETRQNRINRLNDEIAKYRSKIADESSKAASNRSKAERITFGKNDSASTRKSKLNRQQGYLKKASESEKKVAGYNAQVAKLSENLSKENKYLQREEATQRKKERKQQQDLQQMYEERIRELESQTLSSYMVAAPHNTKNFEEDHTKEFDVFVSYASEDKEVVESFVLELKKLGVRVWFDQLTIGWGDSLRRSIDNGLRKSRFGIVFLSPNYINPNKYWTTQELEGLMQTEGEFNRKILPVWHKLTKQQVLDYSPILASKKALTTADYTVEELAGEFKKILDPKQK